MGVQLQTVLQVLEVQSQVGLILMLAEAAPCEGGGPCPGGGPP